MFSLHSVSRACVVQGGLKDLTIVDPLDLTVQPTWNVGTSPTLSFKAGASAFSLQQDLRSGRLRGEPDTNSIAGDFHTFRLDATLRSIRPTVESLRAKLTNRRVHVICTYQDGLLRLLPYMRLAIADDSGARRADKQGYSISGTCRLLLPGTGVGGNIETVDPPTGGGGSGGGGTIGGSGAQSVTLNATTDSLVYNLAAGSWLIGWEMQGTAAQTVSVGLTAGGSELGGPVDLAASQPWAANGNMLPTFNATNIYFSGMTGLNTIRLWLLV